MNKKPKAIIVDLDGTVARNDNRHIYNFKKCDMDTPLQEILKIVRGEQELGRTIVVMTGRPVSCQDISVQWLESHGVKPDETFFKPNGDFRKGHLYKEEMLPGILDKYDVLYFLDDDVHVYEALTRAGVPGVFIKDGQVDPEASDPKIATYLALLFP